MEKFVTVLSSVFSGTDNYPFAFIFPIVALALTGVLYFPYKKALEKLYSQEIVSIAFDNNKNQVSYNKKQ